MNKGKVSPVKITKGQIDEVLANGVQFAKFRNNKVQRRLLKQQEKIRRQQEIRENKHKAAQKAAAKTRRAVQKVTAVIIIAQCRAPIIAVDRVKKC